MIPKITEEQRSALQRSRGRPVPVQDEKTRKAYLLIGADEMPTFWEEYIRREVDEGLAAIDRGEVEDWEVESVKAEGRQVLSREKPPPA